MTDTKLVTIHLPADLGLVVAVQQAVAKSYPDAVVLAADGLEMVIGLHEPDLQRAAVVPIRGEVE